MLINAGTYGTVYNVGDGTVLKKYKNVYEGIAADFIREVATLKRINNPNVISLLEIDYDTFISITLPFYPHNLEEMVKKKLPYSKKEIFHCICMGLYALHSRGIIHRDMKPSNIMVKNRNHAIIIDTGFSKSFELDRSYGTRSPKVVTMFYRAPEIILRRDYSFEVDVWGAGVIFAEMYLNNYLFDIDNEIVLLENQCFLMGTPPKSSGESCSEIEQTILSALPDYPGTYKEKFKIYGEHVVEIIGCMLNTNYEDRCTIAEVLSSDYFEDLTDYELVDSPCANVYKDEAKNYEEYLLDYLVEFEFDEMNENTLGMRKVLAEWLEQICTENLIHESTFFRAVILLDRYLSNESSYFIKKENFQLIGLTCLFISSKYENLKYLDANDLLYWCDNAYLKRELLDMEKRICRVIDMNIATPTLYNYICIFAYDLQLNKKQIRLFKKYLSVCAMYHEHYEYCFPMLCIVCGYICLDELLDRNKEPLSILPPDTQDNVVECQEKVLSWIKKYKK